ncbi:hypothetical protein ABT354_11135 [Streptomyces sp. NPDC000594]|uniref:Lsr2 family DNA-binding protein n=1 Tax=Streptomyces sp. NPDC000594 TaxID=3154261 RepID=UPI003324A8D2
MALCLACKTKGEEQTGTTVIAVGHRAWDLCDQHAGKFSEYLADLFADDGLVPPVTPKGTVVVTGTIPGYAPADARQAVENAGYSIVGHVGEDTVMIVCGIRPAPHKVQEAVAAGVPCMDATRAGVFRNAVTTGQWTANDPLPGVVAKKTAEDVKAEVESEARWREEKNRRLAESRARGARERKEKDDAEIRRLAKAQLTPELTENQKVRAWAEEAGFTISAKGRIPAAVRTAYDHAHAGQDVLVEVG